MNWPVYHENHNNPSDKGAHSLMIETNIHKMIMRDCQGMRILIALLDTVFQKNVKVVLEAIPVS